MSAPAGARTAAPQRASRGVGAGPAAVAGLAAAAVAVGLAELAGGLVGAVASPVVTVGDRVVDLAPPALKDFAVAVFGTADKAVLLAGIAGVCAAAGAALGLLARRRPGPASAAFAGFAVLGAAAAAVEGPARALVSGVAFLLATAAGIATLHALLDAARGAAGTGGSREPDDPPAFDRRRFLRLAAGAGAVAAAGVAVGRAGPAGGDIEAVRAEVSLPRPVRARPPAPPGASLDVDGLSPLFTPNDRFYRIDTALSVPQVDLASWELEFSGMVARPFRLTYGDLLDLPLEEADVTLACVSNEVGGNLVGNARWLGVPLPVLLERAGVLPGASQIVGRSVEGFTVGFPTDVALDGRQAMVAVAMNGEPLPAKHGFPARLVVPGLFGYVSATKWLAEVELTTWDAFDAYWVPRGWDKRAPVLTQSRIDVPRTGARIAPGAVQVAGVAWQPAAGIDRVEVAVDGGDWQDADLADELDDSAWRQWRFDWDAQAGSHEVAVRATDGTGSAQSSVRMGPRPFGATGYHTITVHVQA